MNGKPESETPETDAVEWVKLGRYEGYGWTFARSLERRLSLMTQIRDVSDRLKLGWDLRSALTLGRQK